MVTRYAPNRDGILIATEQRPVDPMTTTMDPNKALAELQRLTAAALEGDDRDGMTWDELADALAEQFQTLDNWLHTGGSLPDEWAAGRDKYGRSARI